MWLFLLKKILFPVSLPRMKQLARRDVTGEHQSKEQRLLNSIPCPGMRGRTHVLGAAKPGDPIALYKAVVFWRELLLWWSSFWFFVEQSQSYFYG